ncbi:hypothetical protein GALL_445700 [mine drainage metagenome]|uniref:DUF3108 domain-containing protein n=1 Tax=mine drainage metagenome TaxID=410659 RepID=A0A1J5Q195_9ZZZZ
MTARRTDRIRPSWLGIAFLGLTVLLLHAVALDWLGQAFHAIEPGRLPPPIYTKLLEPTPPVAQLAELPRVTTAPKPAPAAHPPGRMTVTAPRAAPPAPTAPMPLPAVAASRPLASAPVQTLAPRPSDSVSEGAGEGMVVHGLGEDGGGNIGRVGGPTDDVAAVGSKRPASAAIPAPASASAPVVTASAATAASAPTSAASAPAVSAWPPSTRLSYTITGYWRGALHGEGALAWVRDGDRYEATLSGGALVGFEYRSTGRIDGGWLSPTRYIERVINRVKVVHFNRDKGTLSFSAIAAVLPLQPHVQDSASLFMQLAYLLTTRPQEFRSGGAITFAVARPSGMTDWTFAVTGQETVETAAGLLQCWHVERKSTTANELGAQIWLAPQLQNLPVQIRLQQSADTYLLFTLDHAEQQTTPSAP